MPPGILNANFGWFDVQSYTVAGLGAAEMHAIRTAFTCVPRHILLPAGEHLYRFQSSKSLTNDQGEVPYWWLPSQTVNEIRRVHLESALSFEKVVRATAGQACEFEAECEYELRAQLLVPVYVFIGPFHRPAIPARPSGKKRMKRRTSLESTALLALHGRLEQLFVPNLSPEMLNAISWKVRLPSGSYLLIT